MLVHDHDAYFMTTNILRDFSSALIIDLVCRKTSSIVVRGGKPTLALANIEIVPRVSSRRLYLGLKLAEDNRICCNLGNEASPGQFILFQDRLFRRIVIR